MFLKNFKKMLYYVHRKHWNLFMNIFEYQNYRLYLGDYYTEQKAIKKGFSYRYFSTKAGINASAFLYYIIEGKRNLTKSTITKISQAIGHGREEAEYFENLVFFNQAQSISEKTVYYDKIINIRRPIDIKHIQKDRYEFYRKWYYSVIREVVTFFNFKDDYAKLGTFLQPPVSAKEAKESIQLLEQLGFIERDDSGLYHQTDTQITTHPKPLETYMIEKFQMEMLEHALKSYNDFPLRDRMGSSTTFSISEESFELIKKKTRELRREIADLALLDASPNRVYQLTINLFPLCRNADHE
jgi:uncharacterized protein (TIGR02147 family)